MFSKTILLFLFVITTIQAQTKVYNGVIDVYREMSSSPISSNIQRFGCIVVRREKGELPRPAVYSEAKDSECAKFQFTREGGDDFYGGNFRFKELSTGKLMSHTEDGHWLWFDGDPKDKSAKTLFTRGNFTSNIIKKGKTQRILRPSNKPSNIVYAQYQSGDLNVKGSGFMMYW